MIFKQNCHWKTVPMQVLFRHQREGLQKLYKEPDWFAICAIGYRLYIKWIVSMCPLIGFLRVCALLLEDTRRIYIIIVFNSPIPLDFRRTNSHRTKASNGYCLAVWQFPNSGSSIFTILICLFLGTLIWALFLFLSFCRLHETRTNT